MFDYSVVDKVVNRIVERFSPKMIIVFGSVASHTATDDSDLDLLIVMETNASRLERIVTIEMELRDFTVDRDIFILTPEEFQKKKDDEYSFISEIVKTGYVAYSE